MQPNDLDQGPRTQFEGIKHQLLENSVRFRRATIKSNAAGTAVVLVPADEVPPDRVVQIIPDYRGKVGGATPWGTTAAVSIKTAITGTVLVSFAQAGLTANAVLRPGAANVTEADAVVLGTGADPGEGLVIQGDVNGTGSDLTVCIWYRLVRA